MPQERRACVIGNYVSIITWDHAGKRNGGIIMIGHVKRVSHELCKLTAYPQQSRCHRIF